jgi:hypothetical protein
VVSPFFSTANLCQSANWIKEGQRKSHEYSVLLHAFGEVAGKLPEWADGLISDWSTSLFTAEDDEDELDRPILRVLDVARWTNTQIRKMLFKYNIV